MDEEETNIRFTVHDTDMEDVRVQVNRSSLFALMNITNILGPMFGSIDPIEIVRRNSLENYINFEKKENIVVDLDTVMYKDTEKMFDMCAICQDNFEDNSEVSITKCMHLFHTVCIFESCKYKQECPVCKVPISYRESYLLRS